MIKVNANLNWDQGKVLQTWEPILEKLNLPEELRQFAANYAHVHTLNESASHSFSQSSAASPSSLPLALSILSKLDLQGKNVQLTTGPNFEYIDDVTEKVGFGETKTFMVNVAIARTDTQLNPSLAEELLVKKMVDAINFNLKRYDTLVIYMMADSVSIISEATLAPKIYLKCRLGFYDRNQSPEQFYQVSNDKDFYSVMRIELEGDSYIKTHDSDGNSYMLDKEDNTFVQAISETDVLRLAEELDARAETLKSSASNIRRAIFESNGK